METGSSQFELGDIIVTSMLGMLILALSLVLFFIVYQRKLFQQQQELQRKENEYQQRLLRASLLSQEKERNRIGKDLHDEIGVLLSTAKLYYKHLNQDLDSVKYNEIKEKVQHMLDETMTSIRRISHDLQPVVLEQLGLIEAIDNILERFNQHEKLDISFEHDLRITLSKEYQLNWYRIVQELINNTIKHAHAQTISIQLFNEQDKVKLIYTDDGIGLSTGHDRQIGLGLKNLESRLKLMDGEWNFPENQTKGFKVTMSATINSEENNQKSTA